MSQVKCDTCGITHSECEGTWYFEDCFSPETGHYTKDYFECISCDEEKLYQEFGRKFDVENY